MAYEAKQPGRKLLIWLGVGWPLLPSEGNGMSGRDSAAIFHNIVWLSTKLREGRITLYNVDPGLSGAYYYEQFLKGVGSAKIVQDGNLGIQVLAIQSGGLVLNRSNDLGDSLASCLEDAKDYYILSFDAPAAGHADEYHSLQLKIARPRLTARSRTGYYVQP